MLTQYYLNNLQKNKSPNYQACVYACHTPDLETPKSMNQENLHPNTCSFPAFHNIIACKNSQIGGVVLELNLHMQSQSFKQILFCVLRMGCFQYFVFVSALKPNAVVLWNVLKEQVLG